MLAPPSFLEEQEQQADTRLRTLNTILDTPQQVIRDTTHTLCSVDNYYLHGCSEYCM